MLQRWKEQAERLKRTLFALYLAARHPGSPWYARALATVVVAYAFSPIDLIPDPIPILGYLDDLVLLPAGIWLALRLIPDPVWHACLEEAQRHPPGTRPRSWAAAGVIMLLWLLALYLVGRLLWPLLQHWLTGCTIPCAAWQLAATASTGAVFTAASGKLSFPPSMPLS